jgi:hypothetical protein
MGKLPAEMYPITLSGPEAEENAQDLIADSGKSMSGVKVTFNLVFMDNKGLHIVPCTWLDPYFGFFQVDGVEGFTRMKEIAAQLDARVMGQKIEIL